MRVLALLFCGISFYCSAQESVKEYYYPLSDKEEVKVYKYVDKSNPSNTEYWKVISSPLTNRLTTLSYDSALSIYNLFEEEFTARGSQLRAYSEFETSKQGETREVKAKILKDEVIRWDSRSEYEYHVRYSAHNGKTDFIKKRVLVGKEELLWDEKSYSVLKFRDDYLIDVSDQNVRYSFFQFAYYVKGLGMIKYRRYTPVEYIDFVLVEILSEEEFDTLLKNK